MPRNLKYDRLVSASQSRTGTTRRITLRNSRVMDDQRRKMTASSSEQTRIVFPGGGIFFYWQIGAVSYLQECEYDLSNVYLAGASAGALAATLTATNADFVQATNLALDLAEEAGVWDRPLGLQGVWGPLIERWLDELLPENAAEIANEKLALLVTPVPSFGKSRISKFENKQDLIKCNMASVHLPWFLDGNLTSNFRNSPHIDGSFLSKPYHYFDTLDRDWITTSSANSDTIFLDWQQDPVMAEKANEFVKLVSKEGIWDMVSQGKEFGKIMDERGEFKALTKK
eukprot:CAMPEP_0195514682 /NCGR_PEP_ID=MMETSP0794_2-20130614/5983_1 /TAXON_ID=515487 /ORGANISM="Stephanopyxis turris, Strain CCMP 815" /LENGTH=284 /DNA_ID=CAMNT_0040642965 /DNA_START=367 /DNA_END=1221 /DNA_ORIENTATION=+